MKMEIRNAGVCREEIDFTVSEADMKAETAAVCAEFAGAAALPGFRQGHAPAGMVRRKFAAQIQEELERRVLQAAFEKISGDDKKDILSCNLSGKTEIFPDREAKFTLATDLAPEFETGDYGAIKLDAEREAVTDEEVDKRADYFRTMYGNYADTDTPAVKDDMLKVSYTSDFTPAEDAAAAVKHQAAAEDTYIWLSEPENIPGCIAALTGAEKGREYKFTAEYPAGYREAALAGVKVNYTVKVGAVQRRKALTDEELIAKLGVKSAEEFKNQLRGSLEQEKLAKYNEECAKQYYEKLDAQVPQFDFPEAVTAAETQRELQRLANSTVKNEADAEQFKKDIEKHRAEAAEAAKKSLRRMFILRKLARLEKIELKREEVDAQVAMLGSYYGQKPKAFRDMLEKSGGMEELELDILNNKVLRHLVEKAAK